jgi:hypothetical protein
MPPEPGKPTSAAKSAPNLKALGADDASQKKSTSEKALQESTELEEELAELRVAYEQYFLGNERLPPARAHEDFKKRVSRLRTSLVRNTAAKFRISSLYNKFLTYERLWQRTLQEIEAGTYKRDLFKAKRRTQKTNTSGENRKDPIEVTEEISDEYVEEVADIIPNEPKPVPQPRFIPRPVDPGPVAVPFRPVPSAGPVVPTVAPTVAPVPSIPKGVPSVATPARGSAVVAPTGTPSKGTAAMPPVGTPAKGSAAIPPGGTPSKGTATIPPGGTPTRGTSSPPARGVPSFNAPAQSTSGIAAALESLTDEPLGKPAASPAQNPSRPPSSAGSRPGTASSPGSKPGTPATARPSSPPKPASAPPSGQLSDEKLKAVYDAYVTAKRRNQEDTSKMNYESVAANLRKQVPELLKQHNAKSVEFKVVIKDGKATLKAVPK